MPAWPSGYEGSRVETIGENLATTQGTILTSGAANTKGAYGQMSASTPFDADGFYVQLGNATVSRDFLLDIAVGAAASEQIIVSNMQVSAGSGDNANGNQRAYVPIPIKTGTRVSCRVQSTGASAVLVIQLTLVTGTFFAARSLGAATTYGAATGDSGGVSVDPGAVANTKGSWAQISASLTRPIKALILCVGNQANAVQTSHQALVDLGIGAGGSEVVVADNLLFQASVTDDLLRPGWIELALSIKSGTRLAARAQVDITDATDRLLDVVVVGFD